MRRWTRAPWTRSWTAGCAGTVRWATPAPLTPGPRTPHSATLRETRRRSSTAGRSIAISLIRGPATRQVAGGVISRAARSRATAASTRPTVTPRLRAPGARGLTRARSRVDPLPGRPAAAGCRMTAAPSKPAWSCKAPASPQSTRPVIRWRRATAGAAPTVSKSTRRSAALSPSSRNHRASNPTRVCPIRSQALSLSPHPSASGRASVATVNGADARPVCRATCRSGAPTRDERATPASRRRPYRPPCTAAARPR